MTTGLTRRHQLDLGYGIFFKPVVDRDLFVVDTLGQIGDLAAAALLRRYLADPELGRAAVAAVKAIESRAGTR